MAKPFWMPWRTAHWGLHRTVQVLAAFFCACAAQSWAQTPAPPEKPPVWIGFDDAYSLKTNTSAMAIEWGIKAALEEINASGGVLSGRPLKLMTTDNKGISAWAKTISSDWRLPKIWWPS